MADKHWFGTDGIRGRFGSAVMNPRFAVRLGYIAARVFSDHYAHITTRLNIASILQGSSIRDALLSDDASLQLKPDRSVVQRHGVVIGRDTRISGPVLEHALASGFAAAGYEVYLVGVMATPLVAQLTRQLGAVAGVVVSASHNTYHDNGIKFFDAYGFKINDLIETDIEHRLDEAPLELQYQAFCGSVTALPGSITEVYQDQCRALFTKNRPLAGLKLVVDCAHGAFYKLAPAILEQLGAQVLPVAVTPDGYNINLDCGATSAQTLRAMVLAHGADVGLAFDGDGDRLVMVDQQGRVCDGDVLLYILACYPRAGQVIPGVVGTQMTNLGLEQALQDKQIEFERADVGDRYVLERLRRRSWQLGGENSGHLIDLGISTTGDGLLAGLSVLRVICEQGKTLSQLAAPLELCEQVLTNIPYRIGFDINHPAMLAAEDEVESLLRGRGRLLLRLSGTEPLVRVMVESNDRQLIDLATAKMVAAIKTAMAD